MPITILYFIEFVYEIVKKIMICYSSGTAHVYKNYKNKLYKNTIITLF